VCFSRTGIYEMKRKIETTTGMKVAVIYGGLPPETRKAQARLFNDPDSDYNVLVASDAVGMGLNLNIGRIIFGQLKKFDGQAKRQLTISEVLQVAGRAGRFGFGHGQGIVTCLQSECSVDEVDFLKSTLKQKPPRLEQAGIRPTPEMFEKLAAEFPELPFSAILELSEKSVTLDNLYFLCDMSDMKAIAQRIDQYVSRISQLSDVFAAFT
jgi:ATP-dependent RNA helicase SUPV3L1/SUV3